MDPSDFDEPHPGRDIISSDSEGPGIQAAEIIAPIRPYAQHIIAAIVIIAIAWFAFDYFFASLVQADISVRNTEGEALNNNSIKLFAQGSSEPFFTGDGESVYTLSLRPGNYRYEVASAGYDTKKSSLEVSQEQKSQEITLEKELGVRISGFSEAFPKRVFLGGKAVVTVQLENSSDSDKEIELVGEKGIEGLVSAQGITVPANSTEAVEVTISIPAGTTVKDTRQGDEKQAVLRIKYTTEKETASFTLLPNPASGISVNGADLRASARESKNKDEDEITVRNSNRFPVDSLSLSVEITSAVKNDEEEVLKWLQFTEIANEENPQRIEITSIPAGGSVKKELQLVVPLTAKKELGIKGNIVLDSPYLSEPIKKTLTIDVQEEAEFEISLSLSPASPVEIGWDETLGRYEEKLVSLRVENKGQLDLKNLVFSIENDADCSTDWLDFQENSIELLRIGTQQEVKLRASAPLAVRGQESSRNCTIHYRYDDPVSQGTYFEDSLIGFVEVSPEPG